MKNIFRILMAVAVLFTASCAKEDISSSIGGGEVEMTFTVDLPELGTRAYADGAKATTLRYYVYDGDNYLSGISSESLPEKKVTLTNGKAVVTLPLLKGMTYNIIFWADNGSDIYSIDPATKVLTVDYTGVMSNDDSRDAFYKYLTNVDPTDATKIKEQAKVTLTRPFGQLNAATSDFEAVKNNGVTLTTSTLKAIKANNTLDLTTGLASNQVNITFAEAAIPTETLKAGYKYLSMNYLLPGTVDAEYTFKGKRSDNSEVVFTGTTYTNVPVKANYRTNILGALLTAPTQFTVEIEEEFDEPAEEISVWDGKSKTQPAVTTNPETGKDEYVVDSASDLAWLAGIVNGTLPESRTVTQDDFAGKTFVLTKDIDLNGKEWTPIGTSANPFKGTFDGQGHTISNLYINMPDRKNVGLFGYTSYGEVKNVVINNAKVAGSNCTGVVTGTPNTSKYTNITVKGHVEVVGCGYVGTIGGYAAYADWTQITVDVDDTSFVDAHANQDGVKMIRAYVGGICGFRGEGDHTFSNIKSNINVKGATVDIGGLVGIAHYGNKFVNCVCTGNVYNYSTIEDDAYETGGLAGVWHNETGYTVTMTNCSFTGNLYTPNITEEVAFYNNGLVGRSYSKTGTGKLIIDGAVVVNSVAEFVALAKADIEAGGTELAYTALGANVGSLDGTNFVPADVTVTLRDAKVTGISRNNSADGTLVFDKCSFSNNSAYSINFIGGNGRVVFNNCELVGWCSFSGVTVEMNNCSVAGNGKYALVRSYNTFAMKNCTINCTNTNTSDKYHDGVSIGGGAVMTMTDCTMKNAGYEYGEAADQKTMDYSSYILVDGKRLACNQESLVAAMKNGNAILMENDITVNGYLRVDEAKNKVVDIDGNDHTLTTGLVYGKGVNGITMSNMTLVGSDTYYTIFADSGKVEMTNVTVSSNFNQAVCLGGGGEVVLTNCYISGTPNSDKYSAATIWCG
ncbi:MAG: hypothetical protein IIX34_01260, partial [Alistipes sp.]|nr:hypothetical protein [Alistipes sp.]